ncbi:MAG: GtrA family protein [Halioglobus sp.]
MFYVVVKVSDVTAFLRLKTAAKFALVGLITAGLFFGLLEYSISQLGFRPLNASSICYVIAVVFNYCMHYYWTYGVSAQHVSTGVRFAIMISAGFFLNLLVMYVGVELLQAHYLWVQVLSVVMIAAFNYLVATIWVFRHRAVLGSKHE